MMYCPETQFFSIFGTQLEYEAQIRCQSVLVSEDRMAAKSHG